MGSWTLALHLADVHPSGTTTVTCLKYTLPSSAVYSVREASRRVSCNEKRENNERLMEFLGENGRNARLDRVGDHGGFGLYLGIEDHWFIINWAIQYNISHPLS